MAKSQKEAQQDSVGTPTSIILSVLSAVVIYGIEELKTSISLADTFPLRSVLVSAIALGLALCFFWRRLPQNFFRMMSAGVYLFGLWMTLILSTVGPLVMAGEWTGPRYVLFQQIGLGTMAISALSLMLGFIGQQKPNPSVIATGLGSTVLMALSLFGFVKPLAPMGGEELLSSEKKVRGAVAAAHGEKEEEEISAHDAPATAHEDGHDAKQDEGHGDKPAVAHDAKHDEGHGDKPASGHDNEKVTEKAHGKKGKVMKLSAHSLHGDEEEGHKMIDKNPKAHGSHAKAATDDRDEEHGEAHEINEPKKAPKATPAKAGAAGKKDSKAKDHAAVHWAYEGAAGPRYWSDLAADNSLCSTGKEQSPIDIPSAWPLMDDVTLDYRLTNLSIIDNGHTIQFTPGPGNSALIAGRRFQLMQFHIHAPSEHHLGGREGELEIHFVHKDAKGQLAVIGVLVDKGETSKVFDEIWSFVPQSISNATSPKDKLFNIMALMPTKMKVYRYKGSLTTPPCSENVLWSVASEGIKFSEKQIKAFEARYRNNARPIQSAEKPASSAH